MSATSSGRHADIAPELRALAQSILDRLEPAVRLAALRSAAGASRCEQVWCPVCALAALVTGEQHPLLGLIAEHSTALLAAVRALAEGAAPGAPTAPAAPAADETGGDRAAADQPPAAAPADHTEVVPPRPAPGRYQPIAVTVEE